jgi:two-component system, CAI-1 autoinducer sensor kinase/phosphatase CqsS
MNPAEAMRAWWRQLRAGAIDAPLEPILHASRWRVRWLGAFLLVGNPLFGWIWGHAVVQPYESVWLRVAAAACGLWLLMGWGLQDLPSRRAGVVFVALTWLALPLAFWWMYWCNGANPVWLASVVAMLLIYYHLTDWRIATVGGAVAALLTAVVVHGLGLAPAQAAAADALASAVVVGFAWSAALVLGLSAANLRRMHLSHMLSTMGIMAHELRTPLAAVGLLAQSLQQRATGQAGFGDADPTLAPVAQRLTQVVRLMNHQIDTQISNARLLHLPPPSELLSATALVQHVMKRYPFRSTSERGCVTLQLTDDFCFAGAHDLFAQVLDNLIKNALKSLAATGRPRAPGDLILSVRLMGERGCIEVADRGVGMTAAVRQRIFEAFFSTNSATGHGLGLAFCQRVVVSAGGRIRVHSAPNEGATFTLELPLRTGEPSHRFEDLASVSALSRPPLP